MAPARRWVNRWGKIWLKLMGRLGFAAAREVCLLIQDFGRERRPGIASLHGTVLQARRNRFAPRWQNAIGMKIHVSGRECAKPVNDSRRDQFPPIDSQLRAGRKRANR